MNIFSDIVKSRKDGTPGIDTTNILNELLADDAWLEQVILLHWLFSGAYSGFFSRSGAQHPLGPENPLDNLDYQFYRKDCKDVNSSAT